MSAGPKCNGIRPNKSRRVANRMILTKYGICYKKFNYRAEFRQNIDILFIQRNEHEWNV